MALKAILTESEHSALPEPIQAEYAVQDDGSYRLDVIATSGFALENATGLRSALSAEREAKKAAEQRLESFGDLNPKAARLAIAKLSELGDNPQPADELRAQWEQREAAITAKFEGKLSAADEARERAVAAVRKHVARSQAAEALAALGASPELLLPLVEARQHVAEVDGEYVVQILDGEGRPLISQQDGNTGAMSTREFVETLRENPAYQPAFRGTKASGSDSEGVAARSNGRTVSSADLNALGASMEDIASGKVQAG